MTTVPTISTYKTPLQTSIAAAQYGYGLSADPTNATCFRGILSSNITTLITNQYNASTTTTLDWSGLATLKNTTTKNTNGYYYSNFPSTTANPNNTNNTVTLTSTNPTGTGQKVVVVDGGNIQINSNIDYSGSDKTLVLIARKTNNNGGNIFINPSVTRLDAILIADGALMNATTTNGTSTTSTTTIKNWIDNPDELSNRLTINGRLYSFNTRGGSLITTGSDLIKVTDNTGKYFIDTTLKSDATPSQAAAQDLEGFRIVKADGDEECPMAINYRIFTNSSLPTVLQKPNGYTGGICSF